MTSAEIIEPLGHHELLLVIVQFTALLFVARTLGEAFRSIGQPAVVGELLAGVMLGPSVLGLVAPSVYEWLFLVSEAQFHLLEVISWLGLIMLLIVTGLETDIDLIINKGRTAVVLSLGGIVVPFATGFALGWVLPAAFIAAPGQRLVFSLFLATAMSISAIPVIAKVLIELDVVRRDIGQLILAAGMVDDTIGWILLATVAGLARTGVFNVGSAVATILSVVAFLGVAFTIGRRFTVDLVRWVDNAFGSDAALLSTLMLLALAAGAITQYMGLEAILGAFVVGVLVGQVKRFDYELRHMFEVVTLSIFAPVFFAIAGLRMDIVALADPTVFGVGVVVFGVACFGKFAGIMGVTPFAGLSRWEGITIGGGMNARGAMEIIVATIGLGAGILTIEMYSIIVAIAIVTSLMAPAIMRWSIPKIEVSADERDRIEREAYRQESFVENLTRVLLPTRGGADTRYAARLLGPLLRDREIELDVLCVSEATEGSGGRISEVATRIRRGLAAWLRPTVRESNTAVAPDSAERIFDAVERQLGEDVREPRRIARERAESVAETILEESSLGYDLLVLGETGAGRTPDEPLFSETVNRVVQEAPCPAMIVSTQSAAVPPADSLERILLPTVGTVSSRYAAELAFAIAASENALVDILHVVERPRFDERFAGEPDLSRQAGIGEQIVEREAALGRRLGASVLTTVTSASSPEAEIVDRAARTDADVIVMGSDVRLLSQRAFLGHRVEHVVRDASCPVAVLSA
ncbi:cation:proton antiporter [Haloarchaeobius amylolyticus]|uniref:Cation:proton antiporter n=1 Tax=Haloarchaeobius amylolyticus TaxID=1198296 RepID=A0ABD6BIX7_9EURY